MFYEELYRSRHGCKDGMPIGEPDMESAAQPCQSPQHMNDAIPPFSDTELQNRLRQLKSGKAKDGKGLVAEMLKTAGCNLRELRCSS